MAGRGALADLEAIGPAANAFKEDVAKLARIGCDGEWAGYTRRDLLITVLPKVMLPAPLKIRVPYINPRTTMLQLQYTTSSVLMPNEVFDVLYMCLL